MCEQNGQFVLHGVVSRGEQCGFEDWPGMYASVFKSIDFVKNSVGYVSKSFNRQFSLHDFKSITYLKASGKMKLIS